MDALKPNQTNAKTYANLAQALIAFQEHVPTIHENDNSYHGEFANLPGILSTIGPSLRACGLAVCQLPADTSEGPGLRTTLMHTSGESITAVTPLSIQTGTDSKGRPLNVTQEWGKAMTYTRRYALQAVLGLCVGIEDNDADGELFAPPVKQHRSAVTPVAQPQSQAVVLDPDPEVPITIEQKAEAWNKLKAEPDVKNAFLQRYYPSQTSLGPNDLKLKEHYEYIITPF